MFIHRLLCAFIFFSIGGAAISQQTTCDSLLKSPMGDAMSNNEEITAKLQVLLECGDYTSLTKSYFSKNYRVFGVMSEDIMRFIGDVDYSVLTIYIDSLVQDDAFKEKMWYTIEMIRISKEPTSLDVFEMNEEFFRKMEPDGEVFEELRTFYVMLKPTEMEMQESLRLFYTRKAEAEDEDARKKIDWRGYFKLGDVETAISQVEHTDLLVAIYFTDYADVNSRKMEENVFRDAEVNMTLRIQFIAYEAYCDDHALLTAAENKKFSAYFGKSVETVGDKNAAYLQKFALGSESPTVIILNESGEVVNKSGFTSSPEEFHTFLKSCTTY